MMDPSESADVKLDQVTFQSKEHDYGTDSEEPQSESITVDTKQLINGKPDATAKDKNLIKANHMKDSARPVMATIEESKLHTHKLYNLNQEEEEYNEQHDEVEELPKPETFKNKLGKMKSSAIEVFKPEVLTDFADVKLVEEPPKSVNAPPKAPAKKPKSKCCDCSGAKNSKYFNVNFYKQNPSYLVVFAAYIILSIFFVILQLTVLHTNIPWYVMFARGAAILIYFNTILIILTVLRRIITWVRNLATGRNLSVIDDFIEFHKFMGVWIFILSFIHTLGQCINLYYLSDAYSGNTIYEYNNDTNTTDTINNGKGSYASVLFGTASGVGWIGSGAATTGWILCAILTIMVVFAMPCIRGKGYFQLFYVTHFLYYGYIIVLFFHAGDFWKWFILPLFFMIIERICNIVRRNNHNFGDTFIKDVNLLSSKVTHLVITRPKGFKFSSGDYMFIRIPKIAKNEWHPFTISSASELKDEVWVHVRSLGNWTNKLNEYFSLMSKREEDLIQKGYSFGADDSARNRQETEREKNLKRFMSSGLTKQKSSKILSEVKTRPKVERNVSSMVIVTDFKKNKDENEMALKKKEINLISRKLNNVWIDIQLDGPYGTASGRIFESEHAVLIGGGIGVTPFASILQSLWFQYMQSLKACPSCEHQWYDKFNQKTLKKVDFIWVNRDFEAFEWFVELLGELELQQKKLIGSDRFLSLRLFMTSAKVEQEIKCTLDPYNIKQMGKKNLIKEITDEKNKDFKLKLIPGRPKWDNIMTEIREEKVGKVDVFFCGAPRMGEDIQKACKKFKFNYSQENF